MVHVRHADALGLLFDRVLRLFLRADEENRPVPLGEVACEGVRLLEQLQRLLEIDDVDAAAHGRFTGRITEDEALHLRVPAAGLVAEVNAGLQELSHADDCHRWFLSGWECWYGRRARTEPALAAGTPVRIPRRGAG